MHSHSGLTATDAPASITSHSAQESSEQDHTQDLETHLSSSIKLFFSNNFGVDREILAAYGAMGARGATASSETADVVVLADRLEPVAEAVIVAQRARSIAFQSIIVGLALSGIAMIGAAFGYISPVAGALLQEAIDVAVILNALRAAA